MRPIPESVVGCLTALRSLNLTPKIRLTAQDSYLHSVVVAVTVAYLISDVLWIAMQPDMVSALDL